MSSLALTEDEVMLRDSARGFLDHAAPVAAFRTLRDANARYDAALWGEMASLGWPAIIVPEAAGGAGMGHAAAGLLAGEMGKTLVASPFLSTAVIAATALAQHPNDRALEALGRIAEGRLTYALAVDEGAKHAPEATAMAATTSGNGFRLDGTKVFVADGGFADRLLVLARTSDAPGDAAGLTLFDLPADRTGITREALALIDSRDAARLVLSGVEATGDDIVGEVGEGLDALRPALQAGQAALAAEATGLAAGAFGMTAAYLKTREQFGRAIGSFQALQHRAAHLWSEIEVTASAVLNAGRMLDTAPESATLAVSLAKARSCETARLVVSEGVQMHGGIGMTDAYDIGFYMKRARVAGEWLGDYGYHAEQIARIRGF